MPVATFADVCERELARVLSFDEPDQHLFSCRVSRAFYAHKHRRPNRNDHMILRMNRFVAAEQPLELPSRLHQLCKKLYSVGTLWGENISAALLEDTQQSVLSSAQGNLVGWC